MTFNDFIEEWHNDKDYIVVHTSGSTGQPKEIKLPKSFALESAKRTNSFFKIGKGSRLHSCVSPDFIGGKMMAVRAELGDTELTWENPSNHPLSKLKPLEEIDLVAVVPSQMIYILENLQNLPTIHNIIIGGSSIHPDLRKKIADSGLNAYETYGMTETASHIALRKITADPTPFVTLNGIKVGLNEEICLKIYFESGEVFQTNDFAELVSEREFYILGRKDNVIISGGKKINPVEIEEKISHLLYTPFCITGFPDEKWGEKLVLLIEKEPFFTSVSKEEIKKFSKEVLKENLKKEIKTYLLKEVESWKVPKEIYFIHQLPRTQNGKLLRPKSPLSLLT